MFYKISHSDAPAYLCDMLSQTVGDQNDYNLYIYINVQLTKWICLSQGLNVTGDHVFVLLFMNGIILLMIL